VLTHERICWGEGRVRVAGVDEVGRGPLAGPVVAAAAVLDPDWCVAEEHGLLEGLTDSKRLSRDRREHFLRVLRASGRTDIALGVASVTEIDQLNILRATHLAMRRAVAALSAAADFLLVDGLPVPDLPVPSRAIVGGDGLSLSIAAASVAAKVARDALMGHLSRRFPDYGFEQNMGYGTAQHLRALYAAGPCPEHRLSFAPVREARNNLRARAAGTTDPA
jgi:ribonuclease HII